MTTQIATENCSTYPLFYPEFDEQGAHQRLQDMRQNSCPANREVPRVLYGLGIAPTAYEGMMSQSLNEERIAQFIRTEIQRNMTVQSRPQHIYHNRRLKKRKQRERER